MSKPQYTPGANLQYAIYILAGPSVDEVGRLTDLFNAIQYYEAESVAQCDIYIANDGNSHLHELGSTTSAFANLHIFDNPGHGLSPHVWDRTICGTFACLRKLADSAKDYRFALKLDSDSLVIAPFSQRIATFFDYYPLAGSIGSHLHFPCGRPRPGNFTMAGHIQQALQAIPVPELCQQAGPDYQKRVEQTQNERRQLITTAQQNGFFGSQHVQGGGYALSRNLLTTLASNGWPGNVDILNGTGIGEDVAAALLVKAAGYELMDFNRPGDVFGVWWRQLGLDLQQLIDRQYAIIHSIKDFKNQDENEIRRFFAARRTNQ